MQDRRHDPETAHGYCLHCGSRLEAERGPAGQPGCPACGFVRYTDPKLAAGVVVEHEGGILLVRRNHEPMLGRWSFPSGYVDAGEVVEEAAAREVWEETGVTVRVDHLLGVFSSPGNPVVFVAFAGTALGGTPAPGPEASEVATFPVHGLPALAFDHDDEVIAAWLAATGRDGTGRI